MNILENLSTWLKIPTKDVESFVLMHRCRPLSIKSLIETLKGEKMECHIQLDKDFNPCQRGGIYALPYDSFIFNGGELHIKIKETPTKSSNVAISTRIKNSDDLMQVLFVVDSLKRFGVDTKKITLMMPYLPYARQDRVCNYGESFSLKVFASLINGLNLGKVIIFDCHSDVGVALIDNCENRSNFVYVKEAINGIESKTKTKVLLISPDSGANKKMNKLSEYLDNQPIINCDKVRELSTGRLSTFKVFADDLHKSDCFIVDDICDGGRTFVGIAKKLKEKNAGDIYLFVTHGIFSNGFDDLDKEFKRIYCLNSFKDVEHKSVTQFKIEF